MNYIADPALGKRLSELTSSYDLRYDDYFVVSRLSADPDLFSSILDITKTDNTYKSFIFYLKSKIESGELTEEEVGSILNEIDLFSRKISYSDLSSQLARETSSLLNVNTMAFKYKSEYAPVGHKHEYSNVKAKAIYDSETGLSCIAVISVMNTTGLIQRTEIYIPYFKAPEYNLYEIGDIQMVGSNNRKQINYQDQDFDGWVYADGKQYPKSKFPKAYEMFKTLSGSTLTSFQVPNLNGFIVPENGDNPSRAFTTVKWENELPTHNHSDMDVEQFQKNKQNNKIKIKLEMDYYVSTNGAYDGNRSFHTGLTPGAGNFHMNYQLNITKMDIKSLPAQTEKMTDTETESYPDHIQIQTMVYIGKPAVES